MKRLTELPRKEQQKIRMRLIAGTMTKYVVDGYICYDETEEYKPKKCGRPIKNK